MNELSGAEAFVRMLQLHGVKHIFGLCGDTSLPFYDALYRLDHGITHVLTRDERSAAYMADGYARVTGRVGVHLRGTRHQPPRRLPGGLGNVSGLPRAAAHQRDLRRGDDPARIPSDFLRGRSGRRGSAGARRCPDTPACS